MRSPGVGVLLEEVIDRLLAIAERDDVVCDVGTTQVALDQARMTRIVFDQHDRHRRLSRHGPPSCDLVRNAEGKRRAHP